MAELNEEDNLINRIQDGDESAFEELVKRYEEKIFNLAYRFTQDIEEAKDISQKAFIKVYENIRHFKGASKFFTWFYRITVNLCIDYQRKKKLFSVVSIFKKSDNKAKEQEIILEAPKKNNPEEVLRVRELEEKIKEGIKKLSLKEKQAFELKHYEELKINEIAEIMGIKEGTVKVLLFRAVSKLKEMWGDAV